MLWIGCLIIMLIPLILAAYTFFLGFGFMIVWGNMAGWLGLPTIGYWQAVSLAALSMLFILPFLLVFGGKGASSASDRAPNEGSGAII